MSKKWLPFSCFFIVAAWVMASTNTWAAQVGTVIVDQALIRLQPNEKSQTIGTLERDEEIPVSNLPTNGYFKIRTDSGGVGWVSGYEVRVPSQPKSPLLPPDKEKAMKKDFLDGYEHSRVILAGGFHSFTYTGMPTMLQAEGMNSGMNGLVEFQFNLAKLLFWAIRTEVFSSSADEFTVTTGVKQQVSHFIVPVQLGLVFSPLTFSGFRFGVGGYAGLSFISNLTVKQTTGTAVTDVTYSSLDPVQSASLQVDTGLGESTGLLFEFGFRMHQTGSFPASVSLPTQVPAFKADFSGTFMRMGLEIRI